VKLVPENAILSNEITIRMRHGRTFVMATLYAAALAALVLVVWLGTSKERSFSYGTAPFESGFGQTVFMTIMITQLCLVSFAAPALTASCITGEKERRSFDLLATSLIGPWGLTIGKLLSALAHVGILIVSSLPLVAVCFLFGGISPTEVAEGYLVLVATTMMYTIAGLYCSSRLRTTAFAVGASYGVVILFSVGSYLLLFLLMAVFGLDDDNALYVLIVNPFMAMVSVVYGSEMFGGKVLLVLKLPMWALTVGIYAALSLLMLVLTGFGLKRAIRQK